MTDITGNIYFITSELILFVFLILIIIKWLGFFEYIKRFNSVQIFSSKVKLFNEKIRPFFTLMQNVFKIPSSLLKRISIFLEDSESKITIFISKEVNEMFTIFSLVSRKVIIAGVNSIWSVLFVLFVLIYFILTNF